MDETTALLSALEYRSILAKCLGENTSSGFNIIDLEVKPLDGPRAGFMSDHLRLKLTVRDSFGQEQELRFFAKKIPQLPIHREYVESTKFYEKEAAFYNTLLKDLRQAQGDGGHNRWIPECYFARDDLIVVEDLSLNEYKVFGNRELLDLETCEAVLAELACFHAASVVMEETMETKRPLSELYPSVLEERSGSALRSDGDKGWFQASVRSTIKLVEQLPKYNSDPHLLKSIQDKLPAACEVMNTIVKTSSKYRNTVNHGDIWASNVLVKRSSEGKTVGVRFVDFQLVRYCPPACDVLTLLYIMTDKKFRKKHEEHVLSYYYDEFAKELLRHKLNPENLLSLSEFQETCVVYKKVGIIVTALCLQMILLDPVFVDQFFRNPDTFVHFMLYDRSKEIVAAFHSDEEYRHRIVETMEEFIDTCVI